MDFGLGLVLSFTDNATSGINSAVESLGNLTTTAERACGSLNNLSSTVSLSALSVVAGQLGNSFTNMGSSILGMFQSVLGQVQDTGSEFQSLRITLNALLKDTNKAEDAMSKLMNFAATTPFEINDLTGIFTTITANGLDAFKTLKGATTGFEENLMSAIGDLMAFRPDVPAQQWGVAIRNAFSGEVRSLKNALDINVNDMLGRKFGASGDIAQDFMDLADALGVAGLMQSNMGTLSQTLSNVSDQFTRIKLAIADTGVFDKLQDAVITVANALGEIQGDTLVNFANSVGEALQFVMTPITKFTKKLADLIRGVTKFVSQNPKLTKLVTTVAALSGALLVISGTALKAISSLAGLCIVFQTFHKSFGTMVSAFKLGVANMLSTLLPLALTFAALTFAWRTDFAGIKTMTTSFVSNLVNSFRTAREAVSGSVSDMVKTVESLKSKDDFFSNLTLSIMKVMMVMSALSECWDDYTLSEETFQKAKELGVLPLIESILDLKYRFDFFKKGFLDGWQEIGSKVQTFIEGISDNLDGTIFQSMIDGVAEFLDKLSSGDPQAWYDMGKAFAEFTAKVVALGIAVKAIDSLISKVVKLSTVLGTLSFGGKIIQSITGVFPNIATAITKGLPALHTALEQGIMNLFGSNIPGIMTNLKIVGTYVLEGITSFIGGLSAPIVAAIAVVLAGIVAYVVTHWEEFKSQLLSIWTSVKDEALAIWGAFKEGLQRIWDNLKQAVSPVVDSFNTLKDKFSELFNQIRQNESFQAIVGMLSAIGETIINILVPAIKTLVRFISTTLQAVWNVVVTVFNSIVNIVSSLLSNLMDIIGGILDVIVGLFTGNWEKVFQGVSTILLSIRSFITTILGSIWNIIASIFSGIVNMISSVLTGICNIVGGVLKSIVSIIGSLMNSAFTVVSNIWNKIKSTVDRVVSGMSDSVKNKWNNIKTSITDAIETARDTVKNAIDKIKSFFDFDWSLPKLKLPHISITGKLSISPPSVPKFDIDWYEKGGVFDAPSVIGVGENGREAVMPLENNTAWIGELASKISSSIPQSKPSVTDYSVLTNNNNSVTNYNPIGESITNNKSVSDVSSGYYSTMLTLVASCLSAIVQLNSIVSSMEIQEPEQITPVNTQTVNKSNTDSSTTNYLTSTNKSNTVNEGDTDNSITFAQGSIVIYATGTDDKDLEEMAKKIMLYIKRQKELEDIHKYKK